ncbi:MAG: hypothetical protein E7030_01560 [Akkermansiaceae bacterium]|nr:hypothetical protein [Akkermansiaceae bacterium]
MSNNNEDKYTREGDDNSQVRNIINQLNNDKPSREKSREVVVRADGTKVIRVTKKRKVMVSNDEKNRRSRKKFLVGLLGFFLLASALVAFYLYRMSEMCSESYFNEKKQELCAAWGAESIEITNPRVEGMKLTIDRLIARFPESSMLEKVELNGMNASLAVSSFIAGEFQTDNLSVKVADIRLRKGYDKLMLPRWAGAEPIWNIKNVSCAKLSFSVGHPDESPVTLKNAEAQMYHSAGADSGQVVIINKGTLTLAGVGKELSNHMRYNFNLLDAKLFLSSVSVEDIRVNCQDPNSLLRDKEAERDSISSLNAKELVTADFIIHGRIGEGESLYGPYELEIASLPFALLTHGVYDKIFGAEVSSSRNENAERIKMTLSPAGAPAVFSGKMMITDVQFRDTDLDAKSVYITHIVNANQNRKYTKINFAQAWVTLSRANGEMVLDIADGAMVERGSTDISIHGQMTVNMNSANGQWNDLPLSGHLTYSLPRKVLNSEYKGGVIDPIFSADPKNDLRCVLKTTLSGVSILPQDDSRSQVDATAEARSTLIRAEGIFDVDSVPDVIKANDPEQNGTTDSAVDTKDDIFKTEEEKKNEMSDDEFFGVKDENDIFKSTPGTAPADPSIKF